MVQVTRQATSPLLISWFSTFKNKYIDKYSDLGIPVHPIEWLNGCSGDVPVTALVLCSTLQMSVLPKAHWGWFPSHCLTALRVKDLQPGTDAWSWRLVRREAQRPEQRIEVQGGKNCGRKTRKERDLCFWAECDYSLLQDEPLHSRHSTEVFQSIFTSASLMWFLHLLLVRWGDFPYITP